MLSDTNQIRFLFKNSSQRTWLSCNHSRGIRHPPGREVVEDRIEALADAQADVGEDPQPPAEIPLPTPHRGFDLHRSDVDVVSCKDKNENGEVKVISDSQKDSLCNYVNPKSYNLLSFVDAHINVLNWEQESKTASSQD